SSPVAAGGPEWSVLDGVHSRAVLDVVVRVIQQVENLSLQGNGIPFGKVEASRESKVNLLRPGTIEGIQAYEWTGTAGVDAQGRIRRALKSGRVVDRILRRTVRAPVGDVGSGASNVHLGSVGPAGRELHNRADRPFGQGCTLPSRFEVGREIGLEDCGNRETMALVEQHGEFCPGHNAGSPSPFVGLNSFYGSLDEAS